MLSPTLDWIVYLITNSLVTLNESASVCSSFVFVFPGAARVAGLQTFTGFLGRAGCHSSTRLAGMGGRRALGRRSLAEHSVRAAHRRLPGHSRSMSEGRKQPRLASPRAAPPPLCHGAPLVHGISSYLHWLSCSVLTAPCHTEQRGLDRGGREARRVKARRGEARRGEAKGGEARAAEWAELKCIMNKVMNRTSYLHCLY
ncbi:hypothetical protein E2C01_040909 [Portunus trituberculatus]|uniref:Uncharacterized protein n=1 Tax=Portunus trituberculatus TaxID=210409 RepID=A0A5B7FL08_PORTR|nr:hypothetical protein [Portunus trituberculatus]